MKTKSLASAARSVRVFIVCLLLFNICIAPIGAMAASLKQRSEVRSQRSEKKDSGKAAAEDVFAHPLEVKAANGLPNARPEPAPLPFAPPAVSDISATLTASLLAANGGVDADSDGKADPGDTIAYNLTLTGSGAGGTQLSIANPLDTHTTIVGGSLNSTPVAFDQSVSLNEDATLVITLTGQDPDGSNLTFKKSDGTNFPSNPTTIATAHGTIGNFGSVSCNANGVCSQQVTYTPAANYNGSDSFSFKANDGTANSNENGLITISVNSVNDAPTFTVPGNPTAVNEDAGAQSVANFVGSSIRPAQSGNPTEDTQTVAFEIVSNSNPSLFSSAPTINVVGAAYPKSGTLTYTPALDQHGTATITYHLKDNGCPGSPGTPCPNGGVDTSPDQTFTITVNKVNDIPTATAKSYNAQANMQIAIPAASGLLTGAADAKDVAGNASYVPVFKLGTINGVAPVAGVITSTVAGVGTFTANETTGAVTIDPAPGVTGTVSTNYTVCDNGDGTIPAAIQCSATQTLSLVIAGPVIWFVSPAAGPETGAGTLNSPFKLLSSANTKLSSLGTNQKVFVYSGSTTIGATEVLDLAANNDWLVGQGTVAPATATPFDSFFSITPPAGTIARPTLNSSASTANTARPTVRGTVTMRNNTQVTGVNIDVTGAAAGSKGISGVFTSAGTSLVKDVSVTSAGGAGVDVSGTQTFTYVTSDGTNSPNAITSGTGTALSVVNTTIGANGLTFRSISAGTAASGPANGIILNATGSGGLTVTGNGSANSGGVIQHTTSHGVSLTSAQNISFTRVSIHDTGDHGIFGDGVNNFSFIDSTIFNFGNATPSSGASEDAMHFESTNTANTAAGHGLTGTVIIKRNTIGPDGHFTLSPFPSLPENKGIVIRNHNDVNLNMTVTGTTFTQVSNDGIDADIKNESDASAGHGTATLNVDGSTADGANVFNQINGRAVTFQNGVDNAAARIFELTIKNNFFTNVGIAGRWLASGRGTMNARYINNVNDGTHTTVVTNDAIRSESDAVNGALTPHATVNATITGNNMGGGSIFISNHRQAVANISFKNNTNIGGTAAGVGGAGSTGVHTGINVRSDRGSTVNIDFFSNTGTADGSVSFAQSALDFQTSDNGGGRSSISAFIGGAGALKNILTENPDTAGQQVISLDTVNGQGDIFLEGWNGTSPTYDNFLIANNTLNGTVKALADNPAFVKAGTGRAQIPALPLMFAEGGVEKAADLGLSNAAANICELLSIATPAMGGRQRAAGVANETTSGIEEAEQPWSAEASEARHRLGSALPVPSRTASAPLAEPYDGGVALSLPAALPVAALTQAQLDGVVAAARARWQATGLTKEQAARLRSVTFEVADLPGWYLGEASGSRIRVDNNAGGRGWFVDSTPLDDSEFVSVTSGTRRYTDPFGAPAGHVDLLTAIEHEIGHKLGLEDSYLEKDREDLMYGYLTVGERRSPSPGQAANSTGRALAVAHFLALPPEHIYFAGIRSDAKGISGGAMDGASGERQQAITSKLSNVRAEHGDQKSEAPTRVRAQESETRKLSHANREVRGQRSEVRNHTSVAPLMPTPVGSFPINGTGLGAGFSLPDGKTITITFKATLNAPPNFASYSATQKVSAQATLTGSFVGNPLLSDDPSVAGAADATSTNVDLYDSTSTLSASPSNSTNTGQAVTFTATIGTGGTPNGSATNRTGTVNFKDGGTTIPGCGSQPVSSNQATCITSSLTTGSHANITAEYSGDGNFDPSTSSAFTQTVSKSGTNATLTSSLNPSTVTQNVTFTATITTATSVPNPTGTVIFKDGGGAITCANAGGQTLNGSGVATCQISNLGSGNHAITADYSGDTNFNANNGIVLTGGSPAGNQTVNKATPSVTLVSSLNPAFIAQTVTFTATVSAPGGITATPTGTLTFKDGGVAMTCTGGNQTLSGGVATCQKNNLSAGSHTITVDYPTDSNFNAVSGTAMTANAGQNGNPQVINQSNTTMTVSANVNPSKVSESVTFKLNIKSANLAQVPGPPAGQVKFWDGPANTGTQIGVTKTLANVGCADANSACVSSDATTTLTAGTHTITVEYLGDSNFSANSANLSGGQVVDKSDTTVSLLSSGLTPNVGDSVTFTATVSSSSVITFDDGGTVDFKDGSTTISGCGAKTINASHQATCTTTALPAGARNITGVYSGDPAFNGSTSNTVVQQVGPVCPNSVVVTSAADNGAGTLRQAIADVCDGGTITFDSTTFPAPGPNFINLIDAGGAGVGGELLINKNVTINGPAAGILTVRRDLSAATNFRVFEISSGKTVTITGLTISNGNATGLSPASGGGIYNDHGTLTLTSCVVSGNTADTGGGINTNGATAGTAGLTLTSTTVSGNTANTFGGGVYIGAAAPGSATVVIDKTTFSGNNAGLTTNGSGGGLDSNGAATLTIKNSTFSGNKAGASGGGIRVDGGPTTLTGVTITGNVADNNNDNTGNGGGIDVVTGTFTLQNTIVAGNFRGVGSGQMQQETGTVVGSITSGQQQIDVLTVTGGPVATCSGSGNINLTVTAAGMTGSGTPVLVTVNETDTAAQVTTAIAGFLSGGGAPNITSFFTVTQTGPTELTFTRKAAADTDPTMSVTLTDGSCTGITSTSDSTTTPGSSSGNAKVVVTSTGMAGSPLTIIVPVAKPDNQDDVASKMRAALAANSTINARFTVSGSTNQTILTRIVSVPNDPNLNIETNNDTSTGLTPQLTSSDTTGGLAAASPNDISGTVDPASSYNLIGDTATAGGLTDGSGNNLVGNAGVGTRDVTTVLDTNLADNGGPTRTHKLVSGGPAIDAGNKFTMTTDQRGAPRPVDLAPANASDGSDIGAFEQQAPTPVPTLTLTSPNTGGTTRDSTPDFSAGNLVVGATVELLRGGVSTTPATTVIATGVTMSLTDNTLTTDGTYAYSVKQTINGDAQTSTPDVSVTVDTRPTVTALLSADDTGASTSDKITNNTTPRFTGTADLNTSILLFADNGGGAVQVGTGTSDGSGNWTILSSALADGTYSITAKEVIGGFTGAASTPLTGVVIDTLVAPPSTPVLLPADDSGTLGDTVTNKTTPTFTGTAEANSAIQLLANGNPSGTGSANGSGNWSVASSALSDGTYLMTAVATDLAGNVSAPSGGVSVTIDTQVAAPSTPDLISADDSGAFNNDNYTNKTTPTFTGTAEAGSDVKLFTGALQVGSGPATGGNWSIQSSALTDGTYQITVTATDPAGNVSSASAALSVTIDTQVPAKPSTPDLVAADDTGILNTDNITKMTSPTFTGTAEADATIDLFKGPTLAGTGSVDVLGNWTVITNPPPLADGTYLMTVVATDLAGNQSVSSDPLSVTIDTVPPPAPSMPTLLLADDTGISSSDGITKKNTPNFSGTAEASSIVQLFAGATPVGSGTAAGGNWSITSGLLPDNSYNMTAQATDLAGNTGVASGALPITIDTAKPTVTMSSAVGNPTATTPIPVTVQFSETVFGFALGGIVAANGTIGNFAGSNANYSFDLTPVAAGGVSADVAADVATDTAGNGNTAAVQFNRTFDPSALNATITPISPNPRNSAVSSIQIVFNKAVTGFDLADLKLTLNGGANLLPGGATLNTSDNATWTLDNLAGLTAAQGTYDVKLTAAGSNIQDATSTALASDATASWVTDTTAPTVTVEQVGPDPVTGPTGTTIINFTTTFSESVTGLTPSGVTIFGTANPTIVNVTGSGTTYNLAVQGMSQSGTVRASVNASAAADSAGNGNAASTSVDNTVQFNADNFTTLEVNTTADPGDGVCDPIGTGDGCTLREAINAANADFGADVITFNSTVFAAPGPYTINLGSVLPDITSDMTITGPGAKVLTVKSNPGTFRIFFIHNGATAAISDLTVTNGKAPGGGGIVVGANTLDLDTLTLTRVAVTGNTSTGAAGGGGILVRGTLNVIESTISGNHASVVINAPGGGISNIGTLSVVNSTISGNDATVNGHGGGVFTTGTTTLSNSTIASNKASLGGGVVVGSGTVTLKSTLIGDNTAVTSIAPDVSDGGGGGTFNSDGYNLIENTTGATINETSNPGTNITGQDPQLNPLADNGGSTMTHSLLCASPAIDKGRAFGLTTDQRAGTRPFDFADAVYPNAAGGDGSDIGAVETQSAGGCLPTAIPPTPDPSTNEENAVVITLTGTYSQNFPLTFTITQQPANAAPLTPTAPNCTFTVSMTCTSTVTYTPNSNLNGPDVFKFKVSAGGIDSDPADVNVTVNPVNDAPSFSNSGTQTVAEDAGPQTVANFANPISPGPPDESGQTVQFIVTNNTNAALFSAAPAIDPTGQLTFTSAPNAYGSAQITVVLKDNGGTGGGNVDTSAPQTFTINVTGVADTPSVTNASTTVNTQTTSGLVISRNAADGVEVTDFQITNITNGTLFKNNGTTQINNNDFITFVEGNQGLKFTPALNSNTNGSFDVQSSLTAGGLGGGTATATITINCGPTVVTNSNDSGAGSLRDIILHACPGATITFNMTPGNVTSPITLTSGELSIDKNLTIQGPGANLLTVSGNNASRIFNIQAGKTTGISGLTITNGNTTSDGGGVANSGTLVLTECAVTNSSSTGSGGGVVNTAGATMTITGSTLTGNTAPVGAGVANGGGLTILNSTISANNGRGFTNSAGTATIINSTISGNTDPGIEAVATVSIGNSIVCKAQNNTADVEGTFTSQGNNLIGDKGSSTGFTNNVNGDQVGTGGALVNPLLGALANNGGPTQTHALLPGSPAINAGSNTLANNATLTTDQRGTGFNRIVDTTVDIGAFESRGFTIAVTSGNLQSAVFNTAFGAPLVATVSSGSGEPVNGGQVVFTAPGSGASATFNGGVTTIASVINAGGQASASATANGTVGGPYIVAATGNGVTGTANFNLTNIKANQTINFAALANKTFGDPDFGISATATSPLPVSFAASGNCTVSSPSPGTVHITGAGSCTITASQAGDANYNAATNVLQSFSIAQAATNTALTSSVNPSDLGQSVTFTATVTSGAGTPTSTVQFKDNGNNLGSPVAVNASGAAQFTTSALTGGTHTITADYSGDANFLTSAATLSGGQVVKGQPSLSINDVSITEGDAGTKVLSFTVTLSAASSLTVTTNYATANSTATAPSDYAAIASTVLTFNPGDTSKTVSVTINGDVGFEPDETFFVNLSNAVNATISDNQGLGTIQNDDVLGGFISFAQANYNVSESTGIVTVTVNRTNDVSQAANVDYATDDTGSSTNCAALNTGLASQRCDYTSMFGTLTFAANETQKTIDIPINLDAFTEGPETFTVKLSNPTGGAVLAVPSTATVTINDSASPTPNAIDDTTNFVRQQYRDFLDREADPAGLAFWKNNIDKCNDPAQRPPGQTLAACIEVQRILTSAAFFLSIEFKGTGGLVRDFYVAALDRPLTNNMPGFVEFMRDAQGIQKGVVVGQGNWQQVLEANRTAFMNEFVMRGEFAALYPTTDTPTQYVDKLYQHANVTGTQQERLDAIDDFGGAATAADPGARARALLRVTQNGAFQAREMNRAFVQIQYFGYLRRNPNDPPDNNFNGFNFWVNKLNQFNGDFLQAEMVKAFLSSIEYRQRFGP